MTGALRREYASISDEAWRELDQQARRIIEQNLAAKRVVDFDGPHGWEYAAVNTGRLDICKEEAPLGMLWGTRTMMPLIEIRPPFALERTEMDDISRGAEDPDIGLLEHATEQVARFEDTAIFNMFAAGGVQRIVPALTQKVISLAEVANKHVEAGSTVVKQITLIEIRRHYSLTVGPDEYFGCGVRGPRDFLLTVSSGT